MPLVYPEVTSYRGTDLNTDVSGRVRIVCRLTSGLYSGPQVRGVDTLVPGSAGLTVRNRVRHIRRITLEGFVAGTGSTEDDMLDDFDSAMETLRTLFDPTTAPGTLIVARRGGGTATISARTMPEEPEWGPDDIPGFQAFEVELEAVGSDWVIA